MSVDWSGFAVPKTPPLRSTSYRKWISRQPCAACGRLGFSHAHHESDPGGRGVAIKASDEDMLPLCPECHHRRHQMGYETFWQGRSPARLKQNMKILYERREHAPHDEEVFSG